MASSKADKEAFVTGHEGSNPFEVFFVTLSAPLSVMVGAILQQHLRQRVRKRDGTSVDLPINAPELALQCVVIFLPIILQQTRYLWPYGAAIALIQLCVMFVHCQLQGQHSTTTATPSASHADTGDNPQPEQPQRRRLRPRLPFLTIYRSSVMVLTFVAILAVDFHVFPRRHCKTEVYGYGLMDVGAASFCFSGGLAGSKFSNTLPLIALGVIRLVTNKGLEYQEHVTEYGVHWNFFFTLAVLAVMGNLMPSSLQKPTWALPAGSLGLYQSLLSFGNVQVYIEDAPRVCSGDPYAMESVCDLFAANREGILSCVGYVAVYWMGQAIGQQCLWSQTDPTGMTKVPQPRPLAFLKIAATLWTIHAILTVALQIPVSRRSANSSFCVWIAAHHATLLAMIDWTWARIHSGSSHPTTDSTVPDVWSKINRHGLPMFVIANLLTGIVNLSIDTMAVSDPIAVCIVFAYLAIVGIIATKIGWIRSTIITVAQLSRKPANLQVSGASKFEEKEQ